MNLQQILAEILEQVRGIWRFRWWAAGITWLIAVTGWAYVYSLPDTYQASARVFVDTNSMIRPLMQGLTAQQNTMDEVQLVSTAVLSRPNLAAVARATDLDLETDSPEAFEALVTGLQRRIQVRGGGDNIFTIRYEDNTREKAQNVVAAVLDTFVESPIRAQGDDAEITERALSGEIHDHEARLLTAEAELSEFKKNNLGYMPDALGDYYTRLQAALGDVARAEDKVRLLTVRRDELQRQIEGEVPVFGIMPSHSGGVAGGCSHSATIAQLRAELEDLLVAFTEKHPRYVTLQDTIAGLEARCAAETPTTLAAIPSDGSELEINPVYQNLRIQLSTAGVELVEARGELRSHEDTVAALRRDVNKIAEVETQLKQLNRDYGVVQSRHQELLRRWEDLQSKKRLDPVTDSVQFRRIDPPFALADPVGPNRPMLLAAALVFALGGGVVVAFALNQLKPVYFTRRVLQRGSGLPVLGSISMLLSPQASARRRIGAIALAMTYGLLVLSTIAVVALSGRASEILRALSGALSI